MKPTQTLIENRCFLRNGHLFVASGPCQIDLGRADKISFNLGPVSSYLARALRSYGCTPCDYFECSGKPILRSLAPTIQKHIENAKRLSNHAGGLNSFKELVSKLAPMYANAHLN